MLQTTSNCSVCSLENAYHRDRRYCPLCGNDGETPLALDVPGVRALNTAFSTARRGEAADYRAALPFFAEAVKHVSSWPRRVAVMALYEYVLSFYRSNYRPDRMSSLRPEDLPLAVEAAVIGHRLHSELSSEVRGELGTMVGQIFDDALKEGKLSSEVRGPSPAAKPGGCFIATAAFGSYDAEEVRVLRRFRDRVLLNSRLGTRLTSIYYRVSPTLAPRIRKRRMIRATIRRGLRLVAWLLDSNYRSRTGRRNRGKTSSPLLRPPPVRLDP